MRPSDRCPQCEHLVEDHVSDGDKSVDTCRVNGCTCWAHPWGGFESGGKNETPS